jgi:hypothetical protein
MTIWYILQSFGVLYDNLVSFGVIWYISPRFGMFEPRKIWQPCLTPWKKTPYFTSSLKRSRMKVECAASAENIVLHRPVAKRPKKSKCLMVENAKKRENAKRSKMLEKTKI